MLCTGLFNRFFINYKQDEQNIAFTGNRESKSPVMTRTLQHDRNPGKNFKSRLGRKLKRCQEDLQNRPPNL